MLNIFTYHINLYRVDSLSIVPSALFFFFWSWLTSGTISMLTKYFFSYFPVYVFFLFIFLCLWNLFFNFSSVVTCLVFISENKCELYLWKELHEIKFYIILQNFLLPVSSVNIYEHKFSGRKTQNRSSNLINSSTNVIFSK